MYLLGVTLINIAILLDIKTNVSYMKHYILLVLQGGLDTECDTYAHFSTMCRSLFQNTACFCSMTRFQQALKGAFLRISTCGLLQIVGTEKGIFFI